MGDKIKVESIIVPLAGIGDCCFKNFAWPPPTPLSVYIISIGAQVHL